MRLPNRKQSGVTTQSEANEVIAADAQLTMSSRTAGPRRLPPDFFSRLTRERAEEQAISTRRFATS